MEARLKGNLEAVDGMMAPDYVNHTSLLSVQEPDREGVKWATAQLSAAISNPSIHFEDQLAAADNVVSRFVVHATHDRGELMGVAPTGRELTWMAIFIHRISEGKIAEEWGGSLGLSELLRRQRLEQEIGERARIEQELRVARHIQQASLPEEVPALEGWEISPLYRPAREVGGDFYDFHLLSEGRLGVVIGDATGKGVPAALVMSTTCGMLQLAAQALDSSSPGEVLSPGEALIARIPANMFVTCFYAIVDPESGSLRYANAGHTLPCCKRHNEDQADELSARGLPLGLMPGMPYEQKETTLVSGDDVVFCTDGLIEAHDSTGEMFGSPRLRGFLRERSESGRELSGALMEELTRFTEEGWEQEDDITLLTLRRSAART
ncbi:MAG TPA: SpoIIE family protein phosphatase [Rubrobacter sp.]|jgi:serine phosphatase RsbU (regulator of sigma subunit)|nr:SpoIIE family protein phosphatase [Rubrobacter sp.]